MSNFRVARHGTDSSGRPIFMTEYMAEWWAGVCDRLGFTPTIVQGAFMARAGGGAAASAGYHDQGGCLDLRVWDIGEAKARKVVRECRRSGAAAWMRDQAHGGMDPHIHLVLGTDRPLASGPAWQWQHYLNGGNGMSGKSAGADYHWRPDPLVTEPPEEALPVSINLRDFFRYRLYGEKGGRRTMADVLRQVSADVRAIRRLLEDQRDADPN